MERQQRKLIKAVLNRDGRYLSEEDATVLSEERERFFRLVATGVIKQADFERMVNGIKGPEPSVIFSKVATSNHKKRILAYFTGVGFDNFAQVSEVIVADFLKKYPNPYAFSSPAADFLAAIKKSNPAAKYEEYVREMGEFTAIVYGKEVEYMVRAQELARQAEEWQLDQEAARISAEFLPRAEIAGDPWVQDGEEYVLTPELLEKSGLSPRFLLEIGGVEIALSKVFKVDVHEAAVAYVKFNEKVYVRGYYRSNSQGMWRYLADYVGGNGEIVWYGVGFNEESLTLPLKIQKQLNMIAARGIYEVPGVNMGFFLGGTARRFDDKDEYKKLVAENKMEGAYYAEVSREPAMDFGVLSTQKLPPESIDVDGNAAPNFRNQLDHYTMHTEMYGDVTVRQFPSMDDELRYTMIERGFGDFKKAWVGGIEVNAPITSTGLKKEWVSTGDVSTPLYEYETMTGGYGSEIADGSRSDGLQAVGVSSDGLRSDGQGGLVPEGYFSMWDKYLKLVPIVRRYLYTWRDS